MRKVELPPLPGRGLWAVKTAEAKADQSQKSDQDRKGDQGQKGGHGEKGETADEGEAMANVIDPGGA